MTSETVYFGASKLKVWPDKQRIASLDEPSVKIADFADAQKYHPRLVEKILSLEKDGKFSDWIFRGGCGMKIRHVDRWASIEADLIHARAKELFRQVLGAPDAVVDESWASIYRAGDYCMPHSHLRATASVVYMLDPGDPDPHDVNAGKFYFADPRINACCHIQQGRMTNLLVPSLRPGSMLIFPGHLVHCVNPYSGTRPRITLSWNINPHSIPGSPADVWK